MNSSRYHRQMIFSGIGEAGQQKLNQSHVIIIGCGATGTVLANHLTRAGVGHLTLVDRDFIELHNLQRQMLFDEHDLAENLPKAIAAQRKLQAINSDITIEAVVADVHAETIERLIDGATLVMDGTDNFETRYLLNDACLKQNIPWIYTGVVATYGLSQTIIPHNTACLRCIMPDMPPPGSGATCDTAGVVGPVVGLVASISATEAIKVIVQQGVLNRGIIHVDGWTNSFEQIQHPGPRPNCPACQQQQYEFLEQHQSGQTLTLCGRDAIQIRPVRPMNLALSEVAQTMGRTVTLNGVNPYLLRFQVDTFELTLFADGRAIIKGTEDEAVARSLYARYIGT